MGIYERNYYREGAELNLSPSWNQRSAVSTIILVSVVLYVANIVLSQQVFTVKNQGVVTDLLKASSSDAMAPYLWWRTLTYGLVHNAGNPFHLIFNMLGLYFLGRTVEDRYGRSEFFRIYFVSMLICGVAWLAKQYIWKSNSTLVGASGAVLCIEMLFVLNYPMARVFLFVFPVPAWVLGVFLILTNLSTSQSVTDLDAATQTSIAYDVHFVGILCAVAYFCLGLSLSFFGDLSGAWRRSLRRWTGPKLKIHKSESTNDTVEADRILAKIHESGQDSLTSKERKFLERYSKSVRERKQDH
jgi:membrane associated rhomboid family serine protease